HPIETAARALIIFGQDAGAWRRLVQGCGFPVVALDHAARRRLANDHACRSSTLPHGSEDEFVSAMMPVLNPAGVQDILDMGLLG
ncbi:hypothetical protein, partial [Pseudomonas syringae group genomosp. 7]|uniref:hypothetical protein n=1 Tax=Pseudomonas syringae group genomosp. 7 TaxID=251699 RepID=UPI00376F6896